MLKGDVDFASKEAFLSEVIMKSIKQPPKKTAPQNGAALLTILTFNQMLK